jgi:hypothetical protein
MFHTSVSQTGGKLAINSSYYMVAKKKMANEISQNLAWNKVCCMVRKCTRTLSGLSKNTRVPFIDIRRRLRFMTSSNVQTAI